MVSLALLPAQLPQNSWGIQMRSKAWIFSGVHDELLEKERWRCSRNVLRQGPKASGQWGKC